MGIGSPSFVTRFGTRATLLLVICLANTYTVEGFSRSVSHHHLSFKRGFGASSSTLYISKWIAAVRSVVADVKLARQVTLNKTAADEQQRLQTLFKRSIALMQSETLRADAIKLGDKTKEREKVVVLAIMWITAAVSSLDRVAMSVALVSMSTEFGFSDTMKGLISSLFSVGYGVAILPAGLALSCLSPRLVMTFGLALWSIATVATPACAELLAHDVGAPIFFVRACVGVGESAMVPTIQRLLAVWTTVEQKSFALAFVYSGFHAGTIGAYLLSPIVMDMLGGWRALFYVYGWGGLLLLGPWIWLAKDAPTPVEPRRNQKSVDPLNTVEPSRSEKSVVPLSKSSLDTALQTFKDAPWKEFIQSKGAWGMLLAHSSKNWGLYTSLAWTPTFYAEQYGIGVSESAWLSVLPSLAGCLGGFVAGALADSTLRNMNDISVESTTQVRKMFQAVGLLGPAVALGSLAWNIPEEAWVAQLFLMVAVGLQAFNAGGFEAGTQDKAGPKWIGMLYSITSLPAVIVGTLGVYTTGRVLDVTHQDWTYVFSINAGINVLGAIAFFALFDSKKEFE